MTACICPGCGAGRDRTRYQNALDQIAHLHGPGWKAIQKCEKDWIEEREVAEENPYWDGHFARMQERYTDLVELPNDTQFRLMRAQEGKRLVREGRTLTVLLAGRQRLFFCLYIYSQLSGLAHFSR